MHCDGRAAVENGDRPPHPCHRARARTALPPKTKPTTTMTPNRSPSPWCCNKHGQRARPSSHGAQHSGCRQHHAAQHISFTIRSLFGHRAGQIERPTALFNSGRCRGTRRHRADAAHCRSLSRRAHAAVPAVAASIATSRPERCALALRLGRLFFRPGRSPARSPHVLRTNDAPESTCCLPVHLQITPPPPSSTPHLFRRLRAQFARAHPQLLAHLLLLP